MKKILLPLALVVIALLAYNFISHRVKMTVEHPNAGSEVVLPPPPATPADPPLVEALQLSLLNAESHAKIAGILQSGADPNTVDLKGHPAIYWAIANSDEQALELMIRAGADVNKADAEKKTPLMHAVYYAARDPKLTRLVSLLLENRADVNADADGATALHMAVSNATDNDAGAALVEMLLKKGANPNSPGVTPLIDAAREGKIFVARALVKGGAKLDARGPGGKTPAEIAADNKHPELAQALLQAAAKTGKKEAAHAKPSAKKKKRR